MLKIWRWAVGSFRASRTAVPTVTVADNQDIHSPAVKASSDRHQATRLAINKIMDELEQLYITVIPIIAKAKPHRVADLCQRFYAIHEAMGRVKIKLLPKPTTLDSN
jgi:hypothetical protein